MDFYYYALRYRKEEEKDAFRFLFNKLQAREFKVENAGESITLTFEIGEDKTASTVRIDYFERMKMEMFLGEQSVLFHQLIFKVFENENPTEQNRMKKIMTDHFFLRSADKLFREFLQFQVQLKNIEKIKRSVKIKTIKSIKVKIDEKTKYLVEWSLGNGPIQQWVAGETYLPEYAKIEDSQQKEVDTCEFINQIQEQTGELFEYTVLKNRSKVRSNREITYLWIRDAYEHSKENKFIQAFKR